MILEKKTLAFELEGVILSYPTDEEVFEYEQSAINELNSTGGFGCNLRAEPKIFILIT